MTMDGVLQHILEELQAKITLQASKKQAAAANRRFKQARLNLLDKKNDDISELVIDYRKRREELKMLGKA